MVKEIQLTFAKVLEHLAKAPNAAERQSAFDQLVAMLQRKRRRLQREDEKIKTICGQTILDFIASVRDAGSKGALPLFKKTPGFAIVLDDFAGTSLPSSILISEHPDALELKERGYGKSKRPDDYLESFGRWLKENLNLIPALLVVTKRPRDLTRAQLKEIPSSAESMGSFRLGEFSWRDWF